MSKEFYVTGLSQLSVEFWWSRDWESLDSTTYSSTLIEETEIVNEVHAWFVHHRNNNTIHCKCVQNHTWFSMQVDFILHYSVNRICYLDPALKKVPQKFWIVKGFSFLNGFFCEPSPIRKHPAVGFLQKNKCKKALGVFWEFVMVPGSSMLHFWTIP